MGSQDYPPFDIDKVTKEILKHMTGEVSIETQENKKDEVLDICKILNSI